MIAAVVETMFRSKILGKRRNACQAWLDHLGFAQRTIADMDHIRHLASLGLKIPIMLTHHPLGERKHNDFHIEQIHHRVVVLKAVHSPHRGMRKGLILGNRCTLNFLQVRHKLTSSDRIEWRFVLGRHFFEVQHIDQTTNKFRILD